MPYISRELHSNQEINNVLLHLLDVRKINTEQILSHLRSFDQKILIDALLISPFYIHRLCIPYLLFDPQNDKNQDIHEESDSDENTKSNHYMKTIFFKLLSDPIQLVIRTLLESLSAYMIKKGNIDFNQKEIINCIEMMVDKNDYLQASVGDLFVILSVVLKESQKDNFEIEFNDLSKDKSKNQITLKIQSLLKHFLSSPSWCVRLSVLRNIQFLKDHYDIIMKDLHEENNIHILNTIIPHLKINDLLRFMKNDQIREQILEEFGIRNILHAGVLQNQEDPENSKTGVIFKNEGIKIEKKISESQQEITISLTNTPYSSLFTKLPYTTLLNLLPFIIQLDENEAVKFKMMNLIKSENLIIQFLGSKDWRWRERAVDIMFEVLRDGGVNISVSEIEEEKENLNEQQNEKNKEETQKKEEHEKEKKYIMTMKKVNRQTLIAKIFDLLQDPVSFVRKNTSLNFKYSFLKSDEKAFFNSEFKKFMADFKSNYQIRMTCIDLIGNIHESVDKEMKIHLDEVIEKLAVDDVVNVREKVCKIIKK